MGSSKYVNSLPVGANLLWYEILEILGKGGFGITYLARDGNLDQRVAIKEYLPSGVAIRDESQNVRPNSPADQKTYQWGLDSFLKEAQLLARFKHRSIVHVLSFFRDSNTAYMVMEFEEGKGLDSVLKREKIISQRMLVKLIPPILDGLETLHQSGFIHRDIKPANVLIRDEDSSPVILDFGSARQAITGQASHMTSLLSLGYSPFEQYDNTGNRQGPWSDIYAMGGVLYRCITGHKPIDASIRVAARLRNEADPMESAEKLGKGRFTTGFLKAVDRALMVMENERPQSIAAWRPLLMSGLSSYAEDVKTPEPAPPSSQAPSPEKTPSTPPKSDGPAKAESNKAKGAESSVKKAISAQKKSKKSSWRSFIASLNDLGSQPKGPSSSQTRFGVTKLGKKTEVSAAMPTKSLTRLAAEPATRKVSDGSNEPAVRNAGDVWVEKMTKMEFLWIPSGAFTMGSPRTEGGRRPDEGPLHKIYIDGFWMARYPVTWSVWMRIMGSHPKGGMYSSELAEHPVEQILWEDTQKFLRRFMRLVGRRYSIRLPTEAEWEYAARAGTQTAYYFGNDPKLLVDHAWYEKNAHEKTHPVGQKKPNPWGLYDIIGNVWEWTDDWYSDRYYERSPRRNPRGAPFGKIRVRRGGSWRSNVAACRAAHRNRVVVEANSNALGFRLIRESDETDLEEGISE